MSSPWAPLVIVVGGTIVGSAGLVIGWLVDVIMSAWARRWP